MALSDPLAPLDLVENAVERDLLDPPEFAEPMARWDPPDLPAQLDGPALPDSPELPA